MKNILLILMMTLLTVGCAKTVKIDNEAETKTGKIEEVPKWFVEKTDGKGFMGKKDKFFIYGVGVATSPDLQLATEKATLIAKADIADIIKGEMNRETKTFIQEVGQGEGNRQVVTETQDTIINIITNTKVIGYERWKIQIALTPNDEYRVYIGLQYPLEEYNKLKELVEKEMVAELNSITNNSEEAFNSLEEKI
tara:strand:+ start:68 stop:652 length:585 start_codon:yes stop_codon:yes gene_type:complete